MKFLTPIIFLSLFYSCNSNNNEPCEWEENKFYARVDSVEYIGNNNTGDSLFTVWVGFNAGSLAIDLQDLGKLRDIEFTKEKIVSNQAFVGNSYSGLINDVVKGTCETPLISFDQKRR